MESTPTKTCGNLFPAPFERPLIRSWVPTDRPGKLERVWEQDRDLLVSTSQRLTEKYGELRAQHRAETFSEVCKKVAACGIRPDAWGWECLLASYYLHAERSGVRRRQRDAYVERERGPIEERLARNERALAGIEAALEADPKATAPGLEETRSDLTVRRHEFKVQLADLQRIKAAGQFGLDLHRRDGEHPNKPVETTFDRHVCTALRCLAHAPRGPGHMTSITGAAGHVGQALDALGTEIGADAIRKRATRFYRHMRQKSLADPDRDLLPQRFLS